jgi:hypothetical protein
MLLCCYSIQLTKKFRLRNSIKSFAKAAKRFRELKIKSVKFAFIEVNKYDVPSGVKLKSKSFYPSLV